ncbi:transposase (plasmid) [Rhodococcus erythropolis]
MADTIEKIHQRSRGTYGKRRIRAELLDTYEMNVNHKLMSAIMTELGIAGLPRPGKRKPNLLGVETLSDRVNRGFTASRAERIVGHRYYGTSDPLDSSNRRNTYWKVLQWLAKSTRISRRKNSSDYSIEVARSARAVCVHENAGYNWLRKTGLTMSRRVE